jgi:hypothetical protein
MGQWLELKGDQCHNTSNSVSAAEDRMKQSNVDSAVPGLNPTPVRILFLGVCVPVRTYVLTKTLANRTYTYVRTVP